MALEFAAQRLEIGDVVLIEIPGEGELQAMVARPIERTETTVRATLRAAGRDDFVHEWAVGELVTVLRGP